MLHLRAHDKVQCDNISAEICLAHTCVTDTTFQELEDFAQSFIAHMPLPMASSTFMLGQRS